MALLGSVLADLAALEQADNRAACALAVWRNPSQAFETMERAMGIEPTTFSLGS